jgi:hypothetical protein
MAFLASKTWLYLASTMKTTFFSTFEHNDFANGKEGVSTNWWAWRHQVTLEDLLVRSTKKNHNFANFTLL